eukprot:TRINITY_DN8317_c0_g1_i2.p1 TRINITY_DN8317_c0_g1~~TRINITY_DN8317_c0_g1_i2.p1  ORF type:complete len:1300 (+),score=396.34 TRINITY_DN8317_c0_g1_i2:66-3965(+)
MSQKTSLREILSARFIGPSIKGRELVENLKLLSDALSKLEQNYDTKQIDATAAALVQDYIVKHKDKDVRVLASCSLADIIRIYAPEAPYDDDQLRKIFKLFIDQLRGLERHAAAPAAEPKALFGRYFYLLERLAVVKAFVLLVELDDALVTELFAMFFSIISTEHSAAIRTHVLDIMASCIDEADAVSTALLDVLLGNLLPPAKLENAAAYRLAQNVIFRCAARLQAPIAALLGATTGGAETTHGSSSELGAEHKHEIIFELARISPQLLLRVVPMLDAEVRTEEVDVRRKMVHLLSLIFTSSSSSISSAPGLSSSTAHHHQQQQFEHAYRPLFTALLGRFNDRDSDIRQKMLEFADAYLLMLPPNSSPPADLLAGVEARLTDSDDKTREAAVRTVGNVALKQPTLLTSRLVQQLTDRIRDRKPAVRREAMSRLVCAYAARLSHWGTGDWTAEKRELFAGVPARLLAAYLLPDVEDKWRVEMGVRALLCDPAAAAGADSEGRAERLLHLAGTLHDEPTPFAAVLRMLKDKRSFQADFAALLDLRKQKGEAASAAFEAALKRLGSRMPDAERELDRLRRLLALKDAAVVKALAVLADVDASDDALLDARKEINKRLGAAGKAAASTAGQQQDVLAGGLIDKLSADSLVSRDLAAHLLRLIRARLEDATAAEMNVATVTAQLRLLHELAVLYGSYVALWSTDLAELVLHQVAAKGAAHDAIAVPLLSLMAVAAPVVRLPDQLAAKVRKHLASIALHSPATQAKFAVRALFKLPSTDAAGPLLADAAASLDGAGPEPRRVAGLLAALAELARLVPAEFNKRKQAVMRYVERLLLAGSGSSSKKKPSTKGTAQADVAAAGHIDACTAAVRLIGRSIEPVAKPASEELEVLLLLVKIIVKHGELVAGSGSAALHAALRLAAARALLRLARLQPYEAKFTPENFVRVVSTLTDEDVGVRTEFLRVLLKGLRGLRLPLRYMASLALAGTEPTSLIGQAKNGLQNSVKIRRELYHRKPVHDPDGVTQSALLPEYAVPHAVFLLAHQEQFESDKPKFERTSQQLSFLLDAVFSPESAPLLTELLAGIKNTQDAVWPDSRNIHIVAEIGLQWIKRQYDRKARRAAGEYPGALVLPLQLFILPSERVAAQFRGSALPADFHLPDAVKPPRKRKPATAATADEDSVADESDEEEPLEPKHTVEGPPRARKARTRIAAEEDQEASEQEEPEIAPAAKQKSTRKAGKAPSGSRASAQRGGAKDIEEDEKQGRKRKSEGTTDSKAVSRKKQAKPDDSQKPQAVRSSPRKARTGH